MLVELEVVADDGDDRRGHRLVDVARRQRRPQPRLGLPRVEEQNAQRLLVRRRRPHLGEFERLDEKRLRDRTVEKRIVGALR